LPEMLQLVQGEHIAGQVQQGIQQRAAMPPERMKRSRSGQAGLRGL